LADFHDYNSDEQRGLARILTLVMSLGVLASFLVGWLMDRVGQEVCSLLTIFAGLTQLLILVCLRDRRPWLILSFVIYGLFRQFLFPVFIAILTDRLGFKYFGLLNGIAFGISGITQFFMASLVRIVQGDCHLVYLENSVEGETPCFPGYWKQLHIAEILVLLALTLAPITEQAEIRKRKEQIDEMYQKQPTLLASDYGSLPQQGE